MCSELAGRSLRVMLPVVLRISSISWSGDFTSWPLISCITSPTWSSPEILYNKYCELPVSSQTYLTSCPVSVFHHLKLELLMQLPSLNDEKLDVTFAWQI